MTLTSSVRNAIAWFWHHGVQHYHISREHERTERATEGVGCDMS